MEMQLTLKLLISWEVTWSLWKIHKEMSIHLPLMAEHQRRESLL